MLRSASELAPGPSALSHKESYVFMLRSGAGRYKATHYLRIITVEKCHASSCHCDRDRNHLGRRNSECG